MQDEDNLNYVSEAVAVDAPVRAFSYGYRILFSSLFTGNMHV